MSSPKKIKVTEADLDGVRKRFVEKMDAFIAIHPSIRTQLEFSQLTGIHRNRLSLFIKGKAIPGTEELLRLVKATGCSVTEIIVGEKPGKDQLANHLAVIEERLNSIKKLI